MGQWQTGWAKGWRQHLISGAIAAGLAVLLSGPVAIAQSPPSEPVAPPNSSEIPLQVGVSPIPPLAIKSGSDWDGIAIHLWRELAHELDLDYAWQERSPAEAIAQLAAGQLDVAIVAATAAREQQVDFTQSYYAATLGIASLRQQNLIEVAKAVISPSFLRICLWLSLLLLVIGLLVWLVEHKTNQDMYRPGPIKGIWDGFWWAGVTLTTIGYGDKAPKTVVGRLLALLWMLLAMGITASLTASITSVLVQNQGLQPLQLERLQTLQVGSVATTPVAQYLEQAAIQFQAFETPKAGLEAVEAGSLDAFVYSSAPLQKLNRNTFQRRLQVQDTGIQVSHYAFALAENSPLREPLNRQILIELSESDWQTALDRYLPQSD